MLLTATRPERKYGYTDQAPAKSLLDKADCQRDTRLIQDNGLLKDSRLNLYGGT